MRCKLFSDPRRPALCERLQPSDEMCGQSREQALDMLQTLEVETRPN